MSKKGNSNKGATIFSNASTSQVIESQNLRLEDLATLSLSQVKNLKMLYEDKQLSDESVQLINGYVTDFPRNYDSE